MKYNIEEIEKSFLKALPFPAILFKVVSMIREQKDPLYKLGQEISKDPVLSAKLLETANSPFYGVKQKVSDLPHAISLLGYNDVSTIVMRFVLKQTFSSVDGAKSSRLYVPKTIWLHSLKSAFISKTLAIQYHLPYPLECYTAGLLQDIGQNAIALCIQKREEYQVLKEMNSGKELYEAEREVLGFDHTQCSLQILKKMKISLEIMQAIKNHHENIAKDFRKMDFILALSNILAEFADNTGTRLAELDSKLASRFSMSSNEIDHLDKIYNELDIALKHL